MGRRASGCAGRRSCTASGGKRREASARLGISGWLFAPLNHSSGCDLRLHRADRGTSAAELCLPASELLFLDDLGTNLKTARHLGTRTLKVVDAEQGLAALHEALAHAD